MTKAELKNLVCLALDYLPEDADWDFPTHIEMRLVDRAGDRLAHVEYLAVHCPKQLTGGYHLGDGALMPTPRFPLLL